MTFGGTEMNRGSGLSHGALVELIHKELDEIKGIEGINESQVHSRLSRTITWPYTFTVRTRDEGDGMTADVVLYDGNGRETHIHSNSHRF